MEQEAFSTRQAHHTKQLAHLGVLAAVTYTASGSNLVPYAASRAALTAGETVLFFHVPINWLLFAFKPVSTCT